LGYSDHVRTGVSYGQNWPSNSCWAHTVDRRLAVGGFTLEQIKLSRDRERYPPPGKLIDIDERRLHLLCKGEGTGPTVVMETGAGDASYKFWPIQDKVAEFARVCVYDRAGVGWSEPAPEGRSLEQRADELHKLLTEANVQPPFLLVAHSMGGFIVRLFARDHRNEVAGLVLIDASEEGLNFGPIVKTFQPQTDQFINVLGEAEWSARFGLLSLFQRFHPELESPPGLPENAKAMYFHQFRVARDDLITSSRLVPPSMQEPGGFGGPLGNLPMAVIIHGIFPPTAPKGMPEALLQSQERLAALSSNSIKITAKNSRHYIYVDEPDVVIDAIRRVHAAARDGERLASPLPDSSN
jgi:pimeloyl-ACP methyl ester carboxylesterase